MKLLLRRVLLLIFMLALAPLAQALDYVWRNVSVSGGGFVPNVVFSRVERGLAYARTDIGGVYRWDAATRAWIPLQDAMAQSNYFGAESVALDPIDPNVVYIAAGMYRRDDAAILRSRDRGAHWDVFPVSFRMGGNEDGRGVGERLAIDPHNTRTLYFGSRHDGLMRSIDAGEHWARVDSFPVQGRGAPARGQPTNTGVSFVVFDPAPGAHAIFAGVADPGAQHLFRSDDNGATWHAINGQPGADLLPVKAELGADGVLYIAYCTSTGPNGVANGALYKLDTHSGHWTDITPPDHQQGGFMGLSLDRQHQGTLVVASLNRWGPGDAIWRSTDGGAHWRDIRAQSHQDVTTAPFLLWGQPQANFGWWMAGLAIDPFDSNHVAYTTGATIYATDDDASGAITWRPWTRGIEETAVITLMSPSDGPFHLLSGFGDISGFAHDDFGTSPSLQFTNPVFANTNQIDYAGLAPNVMVRSGTRTPRGTEGDPTLAFSVDFGRTWAPLNAPPLRWTDANGQTSERRFDLTGDIALTVSADGANIIVMTPVPLITRDRGQLWTQTHGLPFYAHLVADRADASRFYAMDFDTRRVFISTDGGMNFTAQATQGLPDAIAPDQPHWREAAWPLIATPGKAGDLWFVSHSGLYHSADGGRSFAKVDGGVGVEALALGAPPPHHDYPALFAIGWRGQMRAVFRSDDAGRTWIRVNDDAHEYGRRFRCIAADPRVFGRVYIGTDGRGILYGEPAR